MEVFEDRAQPIALTGMPIFQQVGRTALGLAQRHCPVRKIAAGNAILEPGHSNHSLFVLLQGAAQVYLDGGPEQPLAHLCSGDCVGELSVIDGGAPSARVQAITDCTLLEVPEHLLWQLVELSPQVGKNLMQVLARRLRKDNAALVKGMTQQRAYLRASLIDPLTGMHNRRWLMNVLAREIPRCQTANLPLSLLLIDVDHFKEFNDHYGHLAGDCALQAVARAIHTGIRAADGAARYGGEEFVAFFPGTALEEAAGIAENLRDTIERQQFSDHQGRPLPGITVSVGYAQLREGQREADLLNTADCALYRAKAQGRNCIST